MHTSVCLYPSSFFFFILACFPDNYRKKRRRRREKRKEIVNSRFFLFYLTSNRSNSIFDLDQFSFIYLFIYFCKKISQTPYLSIYLKWRTHTRHVTCTQDRINTNTNFILNEYFNLLGKCHY